MNSVPSCRKMPRELVSIITPAFNSARFVRQTIESVQAQTYPSWEMIIVDDGSQDNTCEMVEEKADRDNRIRLIQLGENIGPAKSRNIAIDAASGRYIAFLDSDDQWLPDKLRKQIDFMQKHNSVLSYTAYNKIDVGGRRIGETMHVPERVDYHTLLLTNVIGCLTAVYDIRFLGKMYMPHISQKHDYALWLDILKRGHEANGLNECLALYRVRSDSISYNKLHAAFSQWKLYREIERLPWHRSTYYFINYAYHGFKKR